MKVEFYRHSLTEDDIRRAAEVMRSVFLTTGPVTYEFEKKFSELTGINHTVALSSCTAALHLALLALGIGPGDEVIVPAMTFIATATPVLHVGATPVLVDVEPDTGLIDPAQVEAAVTSKTKAVIPVHLYGVMADMSSLRAIADRHRLFLIEDTAHCIEGERDGIRPGQLSDAACYSFYATKNLTCGEGGALAANDPDLADTVRRLRQHGMSKEAADRYHGLYRHWDMVDLGWKYNLDDIHAALLVDQLGRLSEYWERRRFLYQLYQNELNRIGLDQISLPSIIGKSGHHLFTIQVRPDRRDPLLSTLGKLGIGVAVNYRAIHTLTWFRENFHFEPDDLPRARLFGDQTISLPFYPGLRDEEVRQVAETLRQAWQEISR